MRTRICGQATIALALCASADGAFVIEDSVHCSRTDTRPACVGPEGAFVIDDRSFFDGLEHTFLDFETRGDGTPLAPLIPPNSGALMPNDEYADFRLRLRWLPNRLGSRTASGADPQPGRGVRDCD